MELNVPYDELSLKIALMGVSNKLEKDISLQERILNKISEVSPKTEESLNEKIAKHNGISVKDLIDSPNYLILKEEFAREKFHEVRGIYLSEGFDDKESWAMMCVSMGLLRD